MEETQMKSIAHKGNLITRYGETIKPGEEIIFHFAGWPSGLPKPWRLLTARNRAGYAEVTIIAANNKIKTFEDRTGSYCIDGAQSDYFFEKFLQQPAKYNPVNTIMSHILFQE